MSNSLGCMTLKVIVGTFHFMCRIARSLGKSAIADKSHSAFSKSVSSNCKEKSSCSCSSSLKKSTSASTDCGSSLSLTVGASLADKITRSSCAWGKELLRLVKKIMI